MVEAAELTINVEADGVLQTTLQLKALDASVDGVDDSNKRMAASMGSASSSLAAMAANAAASQGSIIGLSGAVTAAVMGLAPLVGQLAAVAGGLIGIAGGAVAAAPGAIALGGAFAYVGVQALEAATGTDTFTDAIKEWTKAGTPMGDALESLKDAARPMFDDFMEFANDIGPKVIGAFEDVVDILHENLGPALEVISRETQGWLDIMTRSAEQVGPVLADALGSISSAFRDVFSSLIPLIRPALAGLVSIIEGFADGLVAMFKPMKPFLETIGKGVGQVFATIGKELGQFMKAAGPFVGTFLKLLTQSFKILGGALESVGKAGPMATGFMKGLNGIMQGIAPAFKELAKQAPAIGHFFAEIGKAIGATNILKILVRLFGMAAESLTPFIKFLGQLISRIGPPLMKAFTGIAKALQPLIELMGKELAKVLMAILPMFLQLLDAIAPLVQELVAGLLPIIPELVKSALEWLDALEPLIPVFIQLLHALMPVISAVIRLTAMTFIFMNKVGTTILKVIGNIISWFMRLGPTIGKVISWFAQLPGRIWDWLVKAWNFVMKWVGKLGELPGKVWNWLLKVIGKFGDLLARIGDIALDLIGKVGGWFLDVGKAIIDGIVNGIQNFGGAVTGAIANLAHDALDAAKNALGVGSPSKEFAKVGRDISLGMAKGITDNTRHVTKAIDDMSRAAHGRMRGEFAVTGGRGGRVAAAGMNRVVGTLRIVNWEDGTAFIDARVNQGVERRARFDRRMAGMHR